MHTLNDAFRFLQAIFPHYLTSAIFANLNPHQKPTRDYTQLDSRLDCYWSIAAFPPGVMSNCEDNALDVRALVIDDVGTKGPSEAAMMVRLGAPTTIVETSPGNFQYGYRLSKPVAVADWPGFFGGIEALIGHKVPLEARAAQTLMRLPMGINTKGPDANGKMKLGHGGTFKVRLVAVDASVELDPDTIRRAATASGTSSNSQPAHSVRDICGLMALIPNNDVHYDEWFAHAERAVALATDREKARDGFTLWSEKSSKHDLAEIEKRWGSVHPTDTSGKELLLEAERADPEGYRAWLARESATAFPNDVASDLERDAALAALAARVAGTVDFILDQQRTARRVLAVLGGTVRKIGKDNWRQFDPATGRWLFQPGNHMLRLVEEALEARRATGPTVAGVNKRSYLSAVADLAAISASVIGKEAEFDKDPLLLGVPSGVLDLREGVSRRVRQGLPSDMVSRSMLVDPAEVGVACPVWERFLGDFTQGDRALAEWLQIFAGYCLTGLRENHVMPFIYGSGTNGKSVFVNALRTVWGEYGKPVDHRLLFEKQGGYHLAPLAALAGARLATVTDVPQGAVWDMHIVKMLVSEDPIEANRMHQDPIVFELMAKFLVSGNHQPTVKDMDDGVRRRLRLLPMTKEVDEASIDLKLAARLRAEYPAILRWALDGLDKYWARGKLGTCSAITDATEEYTTMLDPFGRWLKTLVEEQGGRVSPTDLYRSWDDFRSADGCYGTIPNSSAVLVKKMKERNFRFTPTNGHPYLRGYKLGPSEASKVF